MSSWFHSVEFSPHSLRLKFCFQFLAKILAMRQKCSRKNFIVKNSFQLDSSNSWCLRMLPDLSEFIMPLGWNWKIILTQNLLESCFYSLFKAINEKISVPATWIRLHWENLTTARKSKFRSFADLLAKNCARERGLGILADLKGFRSRRRFFVWFDAVRSYP